jgi:hypothetical protein
VASGEKFFGTSNNRAKQAARPARVKKPPPKFGGGGIFFLSTQRQWQCFTPALSRQQRLWAVVREMRGPPTQAPMAPPATAPTGPSTSAPAPAPIAAPVTVRSPALAESGMATRAEEIIKEAMPASTIPRMVILLVAALEQRRRAKKVAAVRPCRAIRLAACG